MSLLARYKDGSTELVYAEIRALGDAAFSNLHQSEVEAVLRETFERAAHNIRIIHEELRKTGYALKQECVCNFEHPVLPPPPETDQWLAELEALVAPHGHIPASLRMLYRITGACNFAWDYDANPDNFWEGSDPLQIIPADSVLEEAAIAVEEERPVSSLILSADYLHKDEYSGGPAYAVKLMEKPSIDAPLLFENENATFIDYLRRSFCYGGFSRGMYLQQDDFTAYLERVRPRLMPI